MVSLWLIAPGKSSVLCVRLGLHVSFLDARKSFHRERPHFARGREHAEPDNAGATQVSFEDRS